MSAFKLEYETCSHSVESGMRALALESEHLANVIDTFRGVIPALSGKLKETLAQFSQPEDLSKEIKRSKVVYQETKEKLKYARFIDLGKTLVSVPEGFKGNFIEYATVLLKLSEPLFRNGTATMSEYNAILASFVTNKEDKVSLRDHTNFYKAIKIQREEINSSMAQFFPERGQLSKNYLSDVIRRFEDTEELLNTMEKLDRERKKHSLKDIMESVRKSVDMLDMVIKSVESKGITNVSGAAAMNISQGAYELGKYVELISIYAFRVEQMVKSTESLMETVKRIV